MSEMQKSLTVSDVTVEWTTGNILNAANAQLQTGGGVAGAIHRAAGPKLSEACRPLAPIRPGEAVIHALGPVYGRDTPSEELLAGCYRNSLRRAEESGLESVAFPAISTGAFGYPMREAARVAMRTVTSALEGLSSVRWIRFVLTDSETLRIHAEALSDASSS